jgi:phosphate transport system protein
MRESFRLHIRKLETDVAGMGELVITAINRSIEALKSRDAVEAQKIIDDDRIINKRRLDIEERCINLIALQQPVAADLREIIAVLYIITDLERIGDYAEGIAKIVIMLGKEPLVLPLTDITAMAQQGVSMLRRSIEAFVCRDAKTAAAICEEDDKVDALHEKVYRELLDQMINDQKTISRATPLIWASHNLERVADRVTNICERTAYLATGTMHELKTSKY